MPLVWPAGAHGPAVLEALEGVDAQQASARPIAAAHTIWELVLHMIAWKSIVRRRLRGEKVEVTPEVDWPPVGGDRADDWPGAIARLKQEHAELTEVVAGFGADRLEQAPAGGTTAYTLIHGIIQHDLWHAGQIILLRKRRP